MALFSALKWNVIQKARCFPIAWIRKSSTAPLVKNITLLTYDKDPERSFLNKNNHELMFNLTRMDLGKIYRKQWVSENNVRLEFLTEKQVKERNERAVEQAKRNLQMPPILQIEDDSIEVISEDLALSHFSDTKFVITDISYGIKDRDRTILVRETNGVLETAPPSIRKRMNQTYFPRQHRKLENPLLFTDEHLQVALDKRLYEYILNRACIQFEPYEKDFHRITSLVYHHVNDTRNFDELRSTRFFGTMAFYLAWHNMIDNLLIETMEKGYYTNTVQAIALMYNLNKVPYDKYILEQINKNESEPEKQSPELDNIRSIIYKAIGKSVKSLQLDGACLKFIEEYVQQSTKAQKSEVNVVLQASKRDHVGRQDLLQSLLKTHGIQESDV